jgi:hypothetical protein
MADPPPADQNTGTAAGPPAVVTRLDRVQRADVAPNPSDADGNTWAETDWATIKLDFPECLWKRAINYDARRTGVFGYLLAWNGPGGNNLIPDITVQNPFTPSANSSQQLSSPYLQQSTLPPPTKNPEQTGTPTYINCVGVIEKFMYKGAQNGPIYISAYISKGNAKNLSGSSGFAGTNVDTGVTLSWYILCCDGSGDGWYEAAYVQGFSPIKAYLDTETGSNDTRTTGPKMGRLKVSIATESTSLDDDKVDVRLYSFKFQVRPNPTTPSQLVFATASQANVVKTWGGQQSQNED